MENVQQYLMQLEQQSDELESQVLTCHDIDTLNKLAAKYGKVAHPNIGFRLAETYLILNSKESAIDHLVNSSCFGLDPRSVFLATGYADSIGQSMWKLIKLFDFTTEFDTFKYKIYCSAYYCLSQCIASMGVDACDSLRTRGHMIDRFDKKIVYKMLAKYFDDGDGPCTQILSASDYFYASIGYKNYGENQGSSVCLQIAKNNMTFLLALPQYAAMNQLDMDQIAQISNKNQEHLVKNLGIDFQSGLFQLNPDDLRQGIKNYRIKSK